MTSLRACLPAAAIIAAAAAPPLAAQRTGTFEVGAFAQATYFDRTLRFNQGQGGGGARLGFFLLPNLSVEADGSFVPTTQGGDVGVDYFPIRAKLVFNVPAGRHTTVLLGGGYVRNMYRGDLDEEDNGATGLAGVRLGLPGLPSIRLGTYLDYIPSPFNGAGENWNWGLQFGLSFLFGAGPTGAGTDDASEDEAEEPDSAARDSLAEVARTDSLARAREDSVRAQASRDRVAQMARDSVRQEEERVQARLQARRDSVQTAARADSVLGAALRDSLRLTRNRARMAELRDSLERVALRDSLRALMATRETRLTLRGVNFEINEATLLPISRDILQEVARSLVDNPEVTVEVAGHTDNTGSRELNERLSGERAEAVKAFLIENGVAAERMTTQGYAWDQPVASNTTRSGRAENRRTELRRTD
ncbi:MAG: OmpA family protein [Gemmatimonadales bacterium]|nr:OmpA family protein [Gemmatimonadales bacterium]